MVAGDDHLPAMAARASPSSTFRLPAILSHEERARVLLVRADAAVACTGVDDESGFDSAKERVAAASVSRAARAGTIRSGAAMRRLRTTTTPGKPLPPVRRIR
jgi:hypothetical protein